MLQVQSQQILGWTLFHLILIITIMLSKVFLGLDKTELPQT